MTQKLIDSFLASEDLAGEIRAFDAFLEIAKSQQTANRTILGALLRLIAGIIEDLPTEYLQENFTLCLPELINIYRRAAKYKDEE